MNLIEAIRKARVIMVIAAAFLPACGSFVKPTIPAITADMQELVRKASEQRLDRESLRARRIGKSGYYYIIDVRGVVVMHPSAALEGKNFSGFWFTAKILTEKRGCLRHRLGSRTHAVYFSPLTDSEILCLSILADELSPSPADCPLVQPPAPEKEE